MLLLPVGMLLLRVDMLLPSVGRLLLPGGMLLLPGGTLLLPSGKLLLPGVWMTGGSSLGGKRPLAGSCCTASSPKRKAEIKMMKG